MTSVRNRKNLRQRLVTYVVDSTWQVREVFDYLSLLSPGTAAGLLRAIQPLLKHSMALKDALMLILRKAMFSR